MKEIFCMLTWQTTVPGYVVLPVLIIAVESCWHWVQDRGVYSYRIPVASRFWMTRNGCAFEAGEFSQCVHGVLPSLPLRWLRHWKRLWLFPWERWFISSLQLCEPAGGYLEVNVWFKSVSCAGGGCSCYWKASQFWDWSFWVWLWVFLSYWLC